MKTYYHFTNEKLRDGSPIPATGKWLNFKGEVKLCESGLHASAHPFDALQYAPGNLLHKVVLKGIVEKRDDKIVARSRKIVATIDATELLRKFARQQALSVIHLWKAPAVVKEYLETGREDIRVAAWDAARGAAWGAARDAAWTAAGDAADAADAARGAARAARAAWAAWAARAAWDARDAAWTAAGDAARESFADLVKEEFKEVAQ